MARDAQVPAEVSRLKDEGNAFFKAGEFRAAIDAYTSSLQLDPKQHLCYSNRSVAYLKLGTAAEKALADAHKCVELAPAWAKGYTRQAAALQVLKRWDEAEECCSKGMSAATDDVAGLQKMLGEVKSHRFQDALRGTWHGTVSEVLGGYDQEMEFLSERSVRVEVLGRSIVGKYWVDAGHDPHHLTIQVPMADVPPNMPPPLPVPYIAKIDSTGLHLCCPCMKVERPTEFEGPGYCLMKKGPLNKAGESDVAHLGHSEKLLKCAQELSAALPDRRLEEVTVTDEEEQAREKVMAQVRLESSMYSVQKRYGEETMKEVFKATQGSDSEVPEALRGTKELAELQLKLKTCGLLDDTNPAVVKPAPPPPPPPGPAKAVERQAPPQEASDGQGAPSSPAQGSSGVAAAALMVFAVAVVAIGLMAWKRSRK